MEGLVWMDFCAYLMSPQFQVDLSKNRYHRLTKFSMTVLTKAFFKGGVPCWDFEQLD